MKGNTIHLSCGQLRQGAVRREPARAGLLQRQPSRWSCAPRLTELPPFRQRLVIAHTERRESNNVHGDDAMDTEQHACGRSAPRASQNNADAASLWLTGRQWLGRAVCCAVAAAAALSVLAGTDVGAAAAAAAAANAAATTAAMHPAGALSSITLLRARQTAEPGAIGVAVAEDDWYGTLYDTVRSVRPRQSQIIAELAAAAPNLPWDPTPASEPHSNLNLGIGPALRFALEEGAAAGSVTALRPSLPSPALTVEPGPGPGPAPLRRSVLPSGSSVSINGVGGVGSGGSRGVGPSGGELASETEDRLLEVARQVEARVEGVIGALAGGLPQLLQAGPGAAAQDSPTAAAHSLIREVWETVDDYYLDARATGFDRTRWAELRDAALAMPYRDTAAGYRAVRDMLARGLSDPYCRFIGPSELEAMKKYDVSGVGLNLGTATEYVVKTGNELPAPRDPAAGEGIFVVGVSKGSAADAAGVRQGDELLEIQGLSLADSTPFRAAGLLSGAAEDTLSSSSSSSSSSASASPSSSSSGDKAEAAATPTPTSTPGWTAADRSGDPADGSGGGGGGGGGSRPQQQAQSWRGRKGSTRATEDVVRIKVRHVSGEEADLSLVRPRRTLPSAVTASLTRSPVALSGGGRGEELVGTVRLTSFNARAQSDVAAAIRELEGSGASRLVLDLRDNRGGLVTEGLEVARLFLEGDAPIVITERRDAPPDTPRAPGPPLTSAPLLVLVNGHTASASEIVAGALHDNCRAVLAGSRTYGKGLIQSVYELSDGSGLVVTVGKYLTPRGTDIDRYGIKPDFNGVPSAAQYDSTVRACKLSQSALAAAPAPPVYEDTDVAPAPTDAGGVRVGFSTSRGGWEGLFGGRWWR
ncbi:hypothetical protein PLESTB_000957100 [Pleodorina starrii]|uniref:PDZ domain-containing protein n=1 Tax=Pleodorina starrii TaxID=330485 RepID=A0A9W6FCR9_9CHLO|nr:hypothetical protein PLESTM_001141500 [Pleodorina starrii]GLC77818.1 hypothetical protein PLESTB_000957100 [Pleodorina starrii]